MSITNPPGEKERSILKRMYLCVLLLLGAASPLLSQTRFQHIVMVVQENRTPDNLFGSNPTFEPGVDISVTTRSRTGVLVAATPSPLAGCFDLDHTHQNWVKEYHAGKMDGFSTGPFKSSTCTSPPHPQVVYADNSSGQVSIARWLEGPCIGGARASP